MASKIITFTPKQIADAGIGRVFDLLEEMACDGESRTRDRRAVRMLYDGLGMKLGSGSSCSTCSLMA